MKFVDYYEALGVSRDATQDEIRKAYRKLAHKYHPDVAQQPDSEERFKDISVAYATLKDPEKRAAYDQLGQQTPGEDFVPPRQWRDHFASGPNGFRDADFSDIDLSDILAAFAAAQRSRGDGGARSSDAFPGQDYDVALPVTLEQVYSGADTEVSVTLPDHDQHGRLRQTDKTFQIHIPKGATQGQRLRLSGQGGPGFNGGSRGDLYLNIQWVDHKIFRVSGQDLFIDLPMAPWEVALGAAIEVPTLGGVVEMTVPPGTTAGRKLRLSGRGLPAANGRHGDLFAVVSIVMPKELSTKERALLAELAEISTFQPRVGLYTRK